MARLHEQNFLALQRTIKPGFNLSTSTFSSPRIPSRLQSQVASKTPEALPPSSDLSLPMTSITIKPQFKKFTVAELRARRQQGLCYYYDEKYNMNHNYHAQCFALLAPEDLEEMCNNTEQLVHTEEVLVKEPEVGFHALFGEYNPKMLRLKGSYHDYMLNILVDSGSTFNFIKPTIAQFLQVPFESITPFRVYVGSRDFICYTTISRNVVILVQAVSFEMDIYHLNIAGVDLVFGMAWLQRLGRVLTNYNRLSMEFIYKNILVTLHVEQLL